MATTRPTFPAAFVLIAALVLAPSIAAALQPVPDAEADLAAIEETARSLRRSDYGEPQHQAAATALAGLSRRVEALRAAGQASDTSLQALAATVRDAAAQEAGLWRTISTGGQAVVPFEQGSRVAAGLDEVSRAFRGAFTAEISKLRADLKDPAVTAVSAGAGRGVNGLKRAGAADAERSTTFWDGDSQRPIMAAVGPSFESSGRGAPPPVRTAPGGGRRGEHGIQASPPSPQKTAAPVDASAACRRALVAHPTAAGLCGGYPKLAPIVAGVMEAFRQQFGTVQGVVVNLMAMIAGFLIAGLSGFGLVAKIVVSLASFAMLGGTIIHLLRQGYAAAQDYRHAPEASPASYSALLRLGTVGGSALIVALFAGTGVAVARSATGQRALAATQGALARLGAARAGAAADALVPGPIKAFMANLVAPAPDKLAEAANRSLGRAAEHSSGWKSASLKETIKKVAGENPLVEHTDIKTYYRNPHNGMEVVYDRPSNYFRVQDRSLGGSRYFLDPQGNRVPFDRPHVRGDGSTTRVATELSAYRRDSHFLNSDP